MSTVSGVIAESEDKEDSSDVPHSLGLSINFSVLSNPPTSASTTPTHTHRVDPFRQLNTYYQVLLKQEIFSVRCLMMTFSDT